MADIPFPDTSKGSDLLPKTREVLKNCWNTGSYILSRPGITSLSTQTGLARGSFVWDGFLYMVFGTSLLRIDESTATNIGTIAGTAAIDSAIGFNHAVIISRQSDGKGYTLDSSETITEITSSNFVASNSVTHINGRFVYVPFNGDPAFFSDVGDGATIQDVSFFDAEQLPDKNKVVINLRGILYIGGTDSFELFRGVAVLPIPFTQYTARLDYGYIGGLTQYADTYAFIGREKDQDVGIYAIGDGKANKISNEYIDSILTTYTEEELSTAIPQRFKWRGYDILAFTLQRHSFGFNGGWFDLDTRIDGVNVPWRAGFIVHYKQKYYTARASKIGRLDKINTDYGNKFERTVEGGFYNENNDDFTAQSIELGISQGFASGEVGLRLSRDNVLYSETFFRDTGAVGKYSDKLMWNYPGGLGYYPGFMGYVLTTTADIEFSCDKFTLNLR